MKLTYKVMLTGVLSLIIIASFAQESNKKMTKEERKAEKTLLKKEKEEKADAEWTNFQKLAQDQEFIIELDKVTNSRTGQQFTLDGRLNFVSIKGDFVTLQFESHPYLATNGLGGVTFKGGVDDYEYTPPKNNKKPFFVSFRVIEKNINRATKVFISVTKDGNAIVNVGNSDNLYGRFVKREDTKIFVGADMIN